MYYEYYQVQPLIGGMPVGGLLNQPKQDWRWRLKSANHVIIASGQGYTNLADCLNAINLMKSTTATTPVKQVAA